MVNILQTSQKDLLPTFQKKEKIASLTPKELGKQFLNWKTLIKSQISPVKMLSDLVKYPVINEKSYFLFYKKKQYTFDVDLRLTKPQIKKLFENLFDVNVISINTHIPPRTRIRSGSSAGYKSQYKRVILTLKEGQFLNYL